jgi:hypothetical protein
MALKIAIEEIAARVPLAPAQDNDHGPDSPVRRAIIRIFYRSASRKFLGGCRQIQGI